MERAGYSFRVIPSPFNDDGFFLCLRHINRLKMVCAEGMCDASTALGSTPLVRVGGDSSILFSHELIQELAYQKAKAVAGEIVIGVDTMVVLDRKIFGKPVDEAHACKMLRELSGKTHMVVTAIAVIEGENVKKNSTTSYVTFEDLTDEQISRYVTEFKPLDKAGAYGIQEMPEGYIKSYEGSLENIIGLCPKALSELL